VVLFSAVLTTIALPVCAADGQFIPHNTPTYVATAKNLGAKDSAQTIDVSIWLNPHNRAALDALASELYNPFNSSSYRHWLKSSDIAFRFAPTAAEAKVVQDFLESNHLKVVSVGANSYVRARGTVADAENAFHVQLNDYQVGGKALWANASDPYVTGPDSSARASCFRTR
jgi:subtilase family serine protease